METIDFDSIMKESAAKAATNLETAGEISDLHNTSASHLTKSAASTEKAALLKASSDQVADLAKMQATQNSNKIAADLGIDTVSANGILSQLSQGFNATSQAYYAAQANVDEIERNSDLLGNPAGWFKDLVMGDEVRADRDALAGKRDQIAKDIKTINELARSDVQTRLALAETSSVASIRDKANAALATAEATAEVARAEAAGQAVAGLTVLKNAGSQAFNDRLDLFKLQQAQLHHDQQMEMQKSNLELRQKQLAKQVGKDAAENEIAGYAMKYRADLNLPFMSLEATKLEMRMNTEIGEALRRQSSLGLQSSDQESLTVGVSPGAAALNAERFGYDLTPHVGHENKEILDAAASRVITLASMVGSASISEKDAVDIANLGLTKASIKSEATLAKAVTDVYTRSREIRDLDFATKKPLNIEAMLDISPGMAETEVYKQVIFPLMEAETGDITIDQLASGAGELYSTGKLTSSEAVAEMLAITRLAVDNENAGGERIVMGAAPLDNKKLMVRLSQGKLLPSLSVGMPEGRTLGDIAKGVAFPASTFIKLKKKDQLRRLDLLSPTDWGTFFADYRTTKVARTLKLATGEAE